LAAAAGALLAGLAAARADERLSAAQILGDRDAFHIESIAARLTYYDQDGRGYQSQAGLPEGPGSEGLTVIQPQIEVVARQGPRVTHRLWIPVDIVSAASPDAIDALSNASRRNEAGSIDWTTTYRATSATSLFVHPAFHLEEEWRSWQLGVGGSHKLADDNAELSASVNQIVDWFDRFTIHGERRGQIVR